MSFSIHIHNHGFNPGLSNAGFQSNTPAKGPAKDKNPLEDLLIPTGKGGAVLNPEKKEALEKVATYMDKHPEVFGKPHGRDSWLSELKEDNFLSGKEACKFSGAIDMMKDALGAGGAQQGGGNTQGAGQGCGNAPGNFQAGGFQGGNVQGHGQQGAAGQDYENALIPTGNGESVLNPSKKNELESIAKFMDQHPEAFGKPHGKDSWLSELKENNHLNKGETKDFSKAIDMLKDAQGAFGGGAAGGANGGANGAGANSPSAFAPSAGQGQNSQGQGGLDLKGALVETPKGESYLNPSKKSELESIAKFMDQHPDKFGKPHGRDSWLSELKENNHLSKSETQDFKKAIDMMQDAGVGAPSGGATQPQAGAPDSFAGGQGGFNPTAGQPQSQGQGQGGLDLKDALVQTGKGDAYLNPSKKSELESVAKYMDQHPDKFGKPHGKDSWLSELKEDNYLSKNENKAFSKAIDMMQDARGPAATQGAAHQEPVTTQGAGNPQANYSTQGNGAATGTQNQGTKPNLDDVLVQTGKGDAYFNPSKKTEMESVAKFMDQHSESFGKPHGKDSWLSELKEDNYLSGNENKAFSKAIDMMKDAQRA